MMMKCKNTYFDSHWMAKTSLSIHKEEERQWLGLQVGLLGFYRQCEAADGHSK